jgi:hypothetical protein
VKVKEKMEIRTTRVINEITFRPHHWMNNLSCHLKSLEIYVITALNARRHFVFQWIPF